MSHYETLRVAQDASPEDIKQAYRRSAARNHPDREGGDADAMARANAAYTCLSDAARRARYDAGKGGGEKDTPEEEAEKMLRSVLAHAMEEGAEDPIELATQCLAHSEDQGTAEVHNLKRRIERLTRQRPLIRVVGPRNAAHEVIDSMVAAASKKLAAINGILSTVELARGLLAAYRFEDPTRQIRPRREDLDGLEALFQSATNGAFFGGQAFKPSNGFRRPDGKPFKR